MCKPAKSAEKKKHYSVLPHSLTVGEDSRSQVATSPTGGSADSDGRSCQYIMAASAGDGISMPARSAPTEGNYKQKTFAAATT